MVSLPLATLVAKLVLLFARPAQKVPRISGTVVALEAKLLLRLPSRHDSEMSGNSLNSLYTTCVTITTKAKRGSPFCICGPFVVLICCHDMGFATLISI